MKIKSVSGFNFAGYDHIQISLSDKVNYFIGRNGSGKSKLGLDLIWFIFQGIAEKATEGKQPLIGERFRFIGPNEKTALGELVLYDEKNPGREIRVIRKLTKSGTELSFSAPLGMQLDQQWLNDLFNIFLIAPKRFIDLSPKDQALALGIDTSKWDSLIAECKANHTMLNRELKAFGALEPVEPADEVDFSALSRRKDEIIRHNQEQDIRRMAIQDSKSKIYTMEKQIDAKLKQIEALQLEVQQIRRDIESEKITAGEMPVPEELIDLSDIQSQIDNATENNRKATLYQKYLVCKKEQQEVEEKIADNNRILEGYQQERHDYIRQFKFPFSKLSVDDDAGLLLDGKPIKPQYFSSGELIRIVPSLIASQNPELKYVFIQDFNLLDEEMQRKVEKDLTDQGFQLVIEYVGTEKIDDKNCILLRDFRVVEEYPGKVNGHSLPASV